MNRMQTFTATLLVFTALWAGNPVMDEFITPVEQGIQNPPQDTSEWSAFSMHVQTLNDYRDQSASRHPEILLPLQSALDMLIGYYQTNAALDSADYHLNHFSTEKSKVDSLLASIE